MYPLIIKTILSWIIIFSFTTSTTNASGWNDFTLNLQYGFSITKMNSHEIIFQSKNGFTTPNDATHEEFVGPIQYYFQNSKYTLFKCKYKKITNTIDSYYDDQYLYLIANSKSGNFSRILKKQSFLTFIKTNQLTIRWTPLSNPNFIISLLGSCLFLFFSIPILFIKLWPLSFFLLLLSLVISRMMYTYYKNSNA